MIDRALFALEGIRGALAALVALACLLYTSRCV